MIVAILILLLVPPNLLGFLGSVAPLPTTFSLPLSDKLQYRIGQGSRLVTQRVVRRKCDCSRVYFGDCPLMPCPLPRPCCWLQLCWGEQQHPGTSPRRGRKSLEIPSAKEQTCYIISTREMLLFLLFRADENFQTKLNKKKKPTHKPPNFGIPFIFTQMS